VKDNIKQVLILATGIAIGSVAADWLRYLIGWLLDLPF
jgi:hypothetical protein